MIVISTPAGKLSFFSSSTVCAVGSQMSMIRLCVRISNWSIDFLLMCGERLTVNFSMRVGSGTGPATRAPERFAVSTMQWEDRTKFKSAYDEIHGVNRTMKTLQENIGMAKTPELRAQSVEDAAEFRKSNQHILAMRTSVNNIYNQVKTIDKQKERLYKSGISENEIQPQLKILNERQAKIYQAFNKRYFEVVDSR